MLHQSQMMVVGDQWKYRRLPGVCGLQEDQACLDPTHPIQIISKTV